MFPSSRRQAGAMPSNVSKFLYSMASFSSWVKLGKLNPQETGLRTRIRHAWRVLKRC